DDRSGSGYWGRIEDAIATTSTSTSQAPYERGPVPLPAVSAFGGEYDGSTVSVAVDGGVVVGILSGATSFFVGFGFGAGFGAGLAGAAFGLAQWTVV
ncbi:MAG TPA: hypothetical protein VGQ52_16575, partial [Gemmatimonadaceae bacterium]|nr:hypothetical protein [Gemmatimonadaceae bacterium]